MVDREYSFKRTSIHTYRAANGFWYDPNNLEAYLKKPYYFNNTTNAIAALKDLYSGPMLNDLVKDNPFLKKVNK